MAKIKNAASLNTRIRDAEKKVTDTKVKYDSAVQELKVLIEERKELQMKELMREMEKSGKNLDKAHLIQEKGYLYLQSDEPFS